MIPTIIALAIASGLSTLLIRIAISRPPFRVKNLWSQIFISVGLGATLWLVAVVLINPAVKVDEKWGDIFCGTLILLCTFWCNYWIGNFAGGFRVQMQLNIADQKQPITFEEWMNTFGGLGMEAFLKDRLQSILIPWKTIAIENDQLRLLPGWGMFFGKVMVILQKILPKVRSG
jgi:hypothetical protein